MAFLFFLFILLPLTGIFALIWLVTRNKIWGRIIGYFWFGLFCLFVLGTVIRLLTDKKKLDRKLIINMEQPTHHILTSNPTTYRSAWSFYLIFNSPKFGNMFF